MLDDFTERVDTDVSNNAGLMNLPGPPQSFGLYRDGGADRGVAEAGRRWMWGMPRRHWTRCRIELRPKPRVLLAGSSGGFRVAEALALGARAVTVLEPDPVVRGALKQGLAGAPPMAADPRVTLSAAMAQ